MRKIGLGFLAMLMCCLLVAGCAPKAYKPVDLNPQLKSGKFVQKTDNFIVLFDKSASMDEQYKSRMRLALDRDIIAGMIATIPDIRLNAGLRTFWAVETALVYGIKPLDKEAFMKAVNTYELGSGRTPLGRAIAAAGEDLKPFPGSSAMIIISDFEDISGVDDIRPKSVMENIAKVKEHYGDKLCIYTIQVANVPHGKKLAQEIANDGKCGFAVNANELATPASMASFVERVFLGPPTPAEKKPVVEMEAKSGEAKAEAAATAVSTEAAATVEAPAKASAAAIASLENIHFDFDKSVLRPKDRDILKNHAEWLMKNKNYSVIIEGHCDERGTTEYNLALGERRAAEAKKYMKSLGVEESRLKTISYGEEKPLDPGHTEEAWAKNRCDQFILTPSK